MTLTVVIPCRDDPRLFACVRSIDADVEIMVVLNGSTPEFAADVSRRIGTTARVERLPRPNRSRALVVGISAAASDRILLMDTDCTFEPGSLDAMASAFARGRSADEVYKARVVFDADQRRSSALVARSRQQRQASTVNAYKPGLAFDRRLADRLGGSLFDPRLLWKEDAALAHRIAAAGIPIVSVDSCVIHHAALSWAQDLRSTFQYGEGAALARHLEIPVTRPYRSLRTAMHRDGPLAAAYMLLGNQVLAAGDAYLAARLRLSRGRWLSEVAGP